MVTPVFPLPLDTGASVRLFNVISSLQARGHQIGLVSMIYQDQIPLAEQLAPRLADMVLVPVRRPMEPPLGRRMSRGELMRRASVVLGRVVRGTPPPVALLYHPAIAKSLQRLEPKYDVILVELFFMAQNISPDLFRRAAEKLVLVEHDVSFIPKRRRFEVSSGARRWRTWFDYRLWRRIETATLRRFHRVFAMSDQDRDIILSVAPKQRTIVVPNGVDTTRFSFDPRPAPDKPRLLFLGGLQHGPNLDGLDFFVRDIAPEVLRSFPELDLTIVGRTDGAEERLTGLPCGAMLRFAGFVPDLKDVFPQYTAMIVPLRIAGGTRLKILEAMAAGLPVVTTAIGAEGLPVEHGRHVIIAETAEEVTAALRFLTEDREQRFRLVREARKLVEARFTWDAIVATMEKEFTGE